MGTAPDRLTNDDGVGATIGAAPARPMCREDGCERPRYGRGWCRMHLERVRRTGDPAPGRPPQLKHSDSHWVAKDRVRRTRGRADSFRCADCDAAEALVWSYDGTDPDERACPTRGYLYSLDPTRYRARCQSCHRHATTVLLRRRRSRSRSGVTVPLRQRRRSGDAAATDTPWLATDRAVWLYERGLSLRGVADELQISPSTAARLLRSLGVPIRPVGRQRSTGSPS